MLARVVQNPRLWFWTTNDTNSWGFNGLSWWCPPSGWRVERARLGQKGQRLLLSGRALPWGEGSPPAPWAAAERSPARTPGPLLTSGRAFVGQGLGRHSWAERQLGSSGWESMRQALGITERSPTAKSETTNTQGLLGATRKLKH